MTQEDKQLLLQDLCARLPYGVKVHLSRKHNRPEEDTVLNNIIVEKDGFVTFNIIGYNYLLSEIKPYLRPMSSMTIKEIKEYSEMTSKGSTVRFDVSKKNHNMFVEVDLKHLDWLNAHHFDYRGLIEKGLAIEAPEGMYETEKYKN